MIVRKILYIINVVLALLLGLTYIPAFLPQDIFPHVTLLGYLYPFLLLINIVFIIIWLFVKPRHILLPLFFILIRFTYIPRLINIHSNDDGAELKVLTYNVHDFYHRLNSDTPLTVEQLQDSVLEYISYVGAHVLCLQDYDVNITWKKGFHRYLTDSLGYNHFYYLNIKSSNIRNCAIYSKYPIKEAGGVIQDDDNDYEFIFADIKTPSQQVRVYNLHLASYMLGDKEKSDYKKMLKGQVSDTASKNIINKLIAANKIRAKQIRKIIPHIECCQKATIVCGDFNDHPFSSTYRNFGTLLSDSFVSKGNGIGETYNGVFPAYRIDYIWYEQSRLQCVGYTCDKLDYSDHYPVTATFNIKQQ